MKKLTRKILATGMTLVIFVLLATGAAWAGLGMGAGGGAGPANDIFAGIPVDISGTVVTIGISGHPYQIDTGTEVVSVYGFGPLKFWNSLGVASPAVGENIMLEAYEVTFSDGSSRIIAFSVTVENDTVVLRDSDTGVPLWRGNTLGGRDGNASNFGTPRGGGRDRLRDGSCLPQ